MSQVTVMVPVDLAPQQGLGSPRVTMLSADAPTEPLWNSGTTYDIGFRVYEGYFVYESLQASNLNKQPSTNPLWWTQVGVINAYKMFDARNTSQTVRTDGIAMFVQITPGQVVTRLALLNLSQVDYVQVTLGGTASGVDPAWQNSTTSLRNGPSAPDWFHYFVDPITTRDFFFMDLPAYEGAVINVTMGNNSSEDVGCGTLLIGLQVPLQGSANYGMRLGFTDYSRKETNEFGDIELVQRAFSNNIQASLWIPNAAVDGVKRLLSLLRATPTLFEVTEEFGVSRVYGWLRDLEIIVQHVDHSLLSIDIEGLT